MSDLIREVMAIEGCSFKEAAHLVREARKALYAGEYADPEECLEQEFGLEPDFVFDLINA